MWKDAEKFLLKDKYIAPLIKKWGSCTIKPRLHKDYFKHLCGNVIGQQLSRKVADAIKGRFVKAVEGSVTSSKVLKTGDQRLRDCGMSWRKVSFLKDLAKKTLSGDLQTKKLTELSDEEVIKELVMIKGIGRWTAKMFLMFTLARPDVFPLDDLGIKKSLRLLTPGSERFENAKSEKDESEKMKKFAEKHWKPHRTLASWYLWKSLES